MIVKKEGFNYAFNSDVCKSCKGNCRIGESGYTWVNNKEIKKIAKYLNINEEDFKKKYLIKQVINTLLKKNLIKMGMLVYFLNRVVKYIM